MIKRIGTEGRFATAVVTQGFVYLSGLMAKNRNGDVREQTADILAQIDKHLMEAGSDKHHLISVSIWLQDIADFDEMNVAWDAWIDPQAKPVRATVESRNAGDGALVEIMAQALVK
jgi:enamine deaminase RidA (YjgF/YER057c/UK114 family)